MLTAKATFRIEGARAVLDDQEPLAVLDEAEPFEQWLLPRDVLPRTLPWFEVMLLGTLRAEQEPLTSRRTTMTVGGVSHSVEVFGDRIWQQLVDGSWQISKPEPFEAMPLSWERAYGGTARIEIDEGAVVELSHALNPHGRGQDVHALAEALGKLLQAPEGFPRVKAERWLPNLEAPEGRIEAREDEPHPCCWAPMPTTCALRFEPLMQALADAGAPGTAATRKGTVVRSLTQAHPDWLIDTPEREAPVLVKGLDAEGIEIALPALRVLADYQVGARGGTRALAPQALLIDADRRRLTLTYRTTFRVGYQSGIERGVRIRVEEGWDGGGPDGE